MNYKLHFFHQVVYRGFVEATMPELAAVVELAHRLRISIPISEELVRSLGLDLDPIPSGRNLPKLTPKPILDVFQRTNNNSAIKTPMSLIHESFSFNFI